LDYGHDYICLRSQVLLIQKEGRRRWLLLRDHWAPGGRHDRRRVRPLRLCDWPVW